ncbi:MAG: UDP-glucose 4-epimerase GalE [Bdellovibrionales bacterium]|nr:UDP-glucose 4-epimerase GalE [Bdellovibrionales bacterium]
MKNILVTGGAGYIGSHTTDALIKNGFNVVIIDDLSTGFKSLVHEKAKFYQTSILDSEKTAEILVKEKIDGVIHFAAKIIVPESISQPLNYYSTNTLGVLKTLEACKKANVKNFVFSSTAAVYGNGNLDGSLIKETDPVSPINPYGFSKLMSEQIIKDVEVEFGLKSVILRYFNVAGASSSMRFGQLSKSASHLIKISCETACGNRSEMSITGTDYNTQDGTGVRDYIHIEDLADVHVLAIKYLLAGGNSEILNCGYGHGSSVREVIDVMKKVSAVDFKVTNAARRIGDAGSLVSDNSKIKKVLGWTPKKDSLELICQSALDWEKRNLAN